MMTNWFWICLIDWYISAQNIVTISTYSDKPTSALSQF